MKEKLKQKYESLTSIHNETQTSTGESTTQSSVVDNYISDIENLFLDGVFNGDLHVNGVVYATKIQLTEETSSDVERKENNKEVKLVGFDAMKQWSKEHLKHVKIEDSELYRCRMYNADFVNETLFRDNVRMEQGLTVMGSTRLNGDLSIDSPTLVIDSVNNRVGMGTTTPSVALDVSGMTYSTSICGSSITITGTSRLTGNVGIGKASTTNALDVSGNSAISGNLTVKTNVLVVDSSNNRVGIGMNSPTVELDVSGTISATNANIPIGFRVTPFISATTTTWTVPSNVYYLKITGTAGGGGGGYGSVDGGGQFTNSGGGGGAGASQVWRGIVTPGTSLTITVGNGGTAGNSTTTTGGTGGDTLVSIGATTLIRVYGGQGGRRDLGNSTDSGLGGQGGAYLVSASAQYSIYGGDGGSAGVGQNNRGSGGNGGASIWGSGGAGGTTGGSPQIGRAYGSGGGGERAGNGATGSSGIVIIEY